ncbi:hypothetical protein FXF51_27130 [Nonomuraea sp. PA05]|uniref:SAV_2336 N-terminal domain-related protein n=1 Tax=Nonomuraea sp. PA05 TaxID=2604466 RepID=UPI0011DC27D9|nr:SAV_2336 N-terminal domain-related protein [Nonomuraea sp. PA05]TYB61755.1 hypothetical protein FXF51_27130 [Nonomuraea sp. PA05]
MGPERLLELLRGEGVELTARELLDAVWLAARMNPGSRARPATEPDRQEPVPEPGPPQEPAPAQVPAHEPAKVPIAAPPPPARPPEHLDQRTEREHPQPRGTTGQEAMPVELAYPRAIEYPREFVRALRPFLRYADAAEEAVLDEERTVDRFAHEGIWWPEFQAASGRWLDLAFVVDASLSMRVWRPLAEELHKLLCQVPFRDVRRWYLHDDGRRARVSASAEPSAESYDPGVLIDATGQRLTRVLTDGCGPMWWRGTAGAALRKWANTGPAAILHVLPDELWHRTALAPVLGLLCSAVPAQANRSLQFTPLSRKPLQGTPVPVIRPDGRWLAPWARLVTGSLDHGLICAVTGASRARREPPRVDQRRKAAERVLAFRRRASSDAYRLAGYLACTEPLDLRLMWLVQRAMFHEPEPLPMAEVLLSGLLRRRGDSESLAFLPGVRAVLQRALVPAETRRVRAAVSAEIGRLTSRFGAAERYWAMVAPGSGGRPWTMGEAFADLEDAGLLPPGVRPRAADEPADDVLALRRSWDDAMRELRPGDPHRYATAVTLALALLKRARANGNRDALDDCTALLSQARSEAELAGARLDAVDGHFGRAMLTKYLRDRDPLALFAAEAAFRGATALPPPRVEDVCGLVMAAVEGDRWRGSPPDRELLLRCAALLRVPPVNQAAHPLMAGALAMALLALDDGDHDAAELLREAISAAGDDPDVLTYRLHLSASLLARFRRDGRGEALPEAIEQLRLAESACLIGEPLQAWVWAGLGRAHLEEYRLKRTASSLELGEKALRRALDRLSRLKLPKDHPLNCDVLHDLAEARRERFTIQRRPEVADEARVLLMRARDRDPSRFESIDESLARLLIVRYESFGDVHDLWTAAGHLQRLARDGAEPGARLRAAGMWAECEVAAGRWSRAATAYDEAIAACTRTEGAERTLSALCGEAAAVELERGDAERALRLARAGLRRSPGARMSAGAGPSAARGPVVLINVSKRRTDALVLKAGRIDVLPLPGLPLESVSAYARELLTATHRTDEADDEVIVETLSWLWHQVGAPVLGHLGWLDRGRPRPRMWWSAAGPLSFLPLHAAGDGGWAMVDHVISSYIADPRDGPHPTTAEVRTAEESSTDPYEPARSMVRFEGTWHRAENLAIPTGRLAVLPDHEVISGFGEPADGAAPLPAHLLTRFSEVVAVMWPVPDHVRLALQDVGRPTRRGSTAWRVHDIILALRQRFPAEPRIWAALRHFGA